MSMENPVEALTETVEETVKEVDPEIGKVVVALGNISIDTFIKGLITLFVGIVLIQIVIHYLKKLMDRISGVDKTVSGFLISAIRVVLIFILLTIVLTMLGIPVTSLIAVISMFALAVSLSVQNILSNVVSGIVVLITKPFKVGDWIETPSTSGEVSQIDIMYTHLLAVDQRHITIPNSQLVSERITNYSNMAYRKIVLNLRIGYEADSRTVISALLRAGQKAVEGKKTGSDTCFAALSAYKENGIEYLLRVPIETGSYWPVYYDLMLKIQDELGKEGIHLDYATTRVLCDNEKILV